MEMFAVRLNRKSHFANSYLHNSVKVFFVKRHKPELFRTEKDPKALLDQVIFESIVFYWEEPLHLSYLGGTSAANGSLEAGLT